MRLGECARAQLDLLLLQERRRAPSLSLLFLVPPSLRFSTHLASSTQHTICHTQAPLATGTHPIATRTCVFAILLTPLGTSETRRQQRERRGEPRHLAPRPSSPLSPASPSPTPGSHPIRASRCRRLGIAPRFRGAIALRRGRARAQKEKREWGLCVLPVSSPPLRLSLLNHAAPSRVQARAAGRRSL